MKRGHPWASALTVLAVTCLLGALLPSPVVAHGGQEIFLGEEAIYTVAWDPTGTVFATGTSRGNITVYDGLSHTQRLHWKAHDGPINQIEFAPNGTMIASASGGYRNATSEATVKLWNLPTVGLPELRWNRSDHYDWVPTVIWSPDGRFIASASGVDDHVDPENAFGEVIVWDVPTGVPVWTFTPLDSYPARMAWSPDGREIAALGHLSDIWLLNATTHEQLRISPSFRDSFGHASHGWGVDWSPDARYVVGGFSRDIDQDGDTDKGAVVVFDAFNLDSSGLARLVKEAYVHNKPAEWVAWDSTGSYIASCSGADVLGQDNVVDVGEVVIYNFSATANTTLQGMHIFRGGFSFCSSIDWRPGNLTVLAGNADGSARLYILDEDGDGCWVWDDDAPFDPELCTVEPAVAPSWWTDPVRVGLVLGGLAAVALSAVLFLRGRAERAREEEEVERRAGRRRRPRREPPRNGGRRGARR